MKQVFMIVMLFVALATQSINAQNCQMVCPPGCCLSQCSASSNKAAVSTQGDQAIEAQFVALLFADKSRNCTPSSAVGKNGCQPACQSMCQSKCSAGSIVQAVSLISTTAQPTCQSRCTGADRSRATAVSPFTVPAPTERVRQKG
ncbi:MAG: hypothetical protein ABJC12_07515 [Saprospiraceae bacterium]